MSYINSLIAMKKFVYTFSFVGAMLIGGSALAQTPTTVKEASKATITKAEADPAAAKVAVVAEVPKTKISFAETTWEFGNIKQGDVVKHDFVFTNDGDNDLTLKDVKPTCGCTALDWPKEPLKPGESGVIVAQFNSRGKMGKQYKYFTIRYNGDPEIERVAFTGTVVAPPKPPVVDKPKSIAGPNGSSAAK